MFANKTYEAQLRELYSYKRLGIRPALPAIKKLLKVLGNPHKKAGFFHVAGTNGKGSTTGAIASILKEAGYKTGAFFSPHVIDYRERIQINGKMISKRQVLETLRKMGRLYEKAKRKKEAPAKITFFEWTTALAFYYFAVNKVDVAVMETGMGGRFDATNVIRPLVSVITNISMEHKVFLGNSKAKIAMEKAGIIKRGVPMVCGETSLAAKDVIAKRANELNAPASFYGEDFWVRGKRFISLELGLDINPLMPGGFQLLNSSLAVEAVMRAKGISVSPKAIQKGLAKNSLPGRFEIAERKGVVVVYDVAHNPPSVRELIKNLKNSFGGKKYCVVFGVLKGKELRAVLKMLAPLTKEMAIIAPDEVRCVCAEEVLKTAKSFGIKAKKCAVSGELLRFIKKASASTSVPVIATGSFTVVEAVKKTLKKL